MRISKHSLTQAGDTIVEVMVVLAVLGLAIGISFSTASRSLKNTRAAQDNAEASELLQAQLETLRYLAPTLAKDPTLAGLSNPFCIDIAAAQSTPNKTAIKTAASCSGLGNNNQYTVKISYDSSSGTFELKAYWNDVITTNKQDSVTYNYRPYN